MTQISIIVPIYNVENYVLLSLESIYKQGLDEESFEVILINDGSTDKSMEIIADFILHHKNIIVINQENQGLSVARNNGIAHARGEYILMPDSDDLLIENSLPTLLDLAIKNQADLVVADFIEMYDEQINQYNKNKVEPFTVQEKTGEELFLQDLNPYQCYVWRTLYRRAFLVENNLRFIPGIYFQDVPFTHECYLRANKCLRVSKPLNIYRLQRAGAATASFSKKKAKDFCIVIGKTWELTNLYGLSSEGINKIKDDMYITFSSLIYSILYSIKESSDQMEVIRFLNITAPNLKFSNGNKQKAESFILRKSPFLYLTIRKLYWTWIHYFKRTDK